MSSSDQVISSLEQQISDQILHCCQFLTDRAVQFSFSDFEKQLRTKFTSIESQFEAMNSKVEKAKLTGYTKVLSSLSKSPSRAYRSQESSSGVQDAIGYASNPSSDRSPLKMVPRKGPYPRKSYEGQLSDLNSRMKVSDLAYERVIESFEHSLPRMIDSKNQIFDLFKRLRSLECTLMSSEGKEKVQEIPNSGEALPTEAPDHSRLNLFSSPQSLESSGGPSKQEDLNESLSKFELMLSFGPVISFGERTCSKNLQLKNKN